MSNSVSDPTFYDLANEFLRLLRSGECSSVEEFAKRRPEHSDLILREFGGIALVEKLGASSMPEAPKQVGRYDIEKEIGRGGMGVVYAARHPTLGTELAVKIVPISKIQACNTEVRFRAEARACAEMDHPHIVPVFDYGVTETFAYLAMRRIRGQSLETIVKKIDSDNVFNPLGWRQIATIGSQAADALQYSHEQGIIHRDIKPANMILDHRQKVWITDFGLAKISEESSSVTQTGDIVGTPRYMAPERLQGISSPTTDVFGVGLTLFELVTGRRVWDNLDDHQLTLDGERLALPDVREVCPAVPEDLSKIIMKACAFNPGDRYQTAEELRFVLDRFIDGSDQADRRRKKNNTRSRWHRRDVLYVMTVLTTLLCLAAVYWVRNLQNGRKITSEKIVQAYEKNETKAEVVEAIPKVLTSELFYSDNKSERIAVTQLADSMLPVVMEELGLDDKHQEQVFSDYQVWREAFQDSRMDTYRDYMKKQESTSIKTEEFPFQLLDRLQQDVVLSELSKLHKTRAVELLNSIKELGRQDSSHERLMPVLILCHQFPHNDQSTAPKEYEENLRRWVRGLEQAWNARTISQSALKSKDGKQKE